jgi:hypothetical protein
MRVIALSLLVGCATVDDGRTFRLVGAPPCPENHAPTHYGCEYLGYSPAHHTAEHPESEMDRSQ